MRGDGQLVQRLVLELKPAALFFDFDRTMCDTKSGNPPKLGMLFSNGVL